MMKKRRLFLGAFSVASCTPIATTLDSGLLPIHDGGTDAGTDAGSVDAGSRCYRADGGCPVPPDFPPDASGTFYEEELCYCTTNPVVWCADETTIRCDSWSCNPAKETDGGVQYLPDGGVQCLC